MIPGDLRKRRLRSEVASTFVLALPIVLGQLLTVAMNTIDTVIAGQLGTHVLAAVAQGYQIWVVVLLVVIGVMLAVTPVAAQLDGANRRHEIGAVFRQALWLALAIGIVLMVSIRHAHPLLSLARVAPEIIPGALEFLRAISWGAPALAIFFACKNMSEGLSLTRPTLYFSLLGVIVLLPVAVVLMYGRFGIEPMGAAGAGYAHAIAIWIQALAFLFYVGRRRSYRGAGLFARFEWPQLHAMGELLRIGVPMGTALFMEGSLFVATGLLVGSLGEVPAAAHAIAINVASAAFMVPLGIAMATTVRVGNAVGRRDPDAAAWAAIAGLVLVLLAQVISAGSLLLFPTTIVGWYSSDTAVLGLAASLLWFAAVFQFSDGIQALANGALRGLKDTTVPAAITIVAYWLVGFSVGWWLGLERGMGARGLWIGLIAGLTVAATLLSLRFVLRIRQLRRVGISAQLARDPDPLVEN